MLNRSLFFLLYIAILLFLIPVNTLAQGCAMCGTALSAGDPITNGFRWSILFLIAMPYVIAGSIAGWMFYTYRISRRASVQRGSDKFMDVIQ